MFEVIFGIFIGLGYAMFFPDSLESIKKKVMNVTNKDHKCDDKTDNRRFRK